LYWQLRESNVFDPSKSGGSLSQTIWKVAKDLFLAQLAELRLEIELARLLVLNAADMIDRVGAKGALTHIAIAKVCRSKAMRLTCRSSSLKLQDECWTEPFKSMVQKGCARIN
jgi:hypothetical protein